MRLVFWLSVVGVLYPYVGYPLLLVALCRLSLQKAAAVPASLPSVTMVIPAYNEGVRIDAKIRNTTALKYPIPVQIILVSDGSTDNTLAIMEQAAGPNVIVLSLAERRGKGAALNAAVQRAAGEIVVFSDASIVLNDDALTNIVRPFCDPSVGCVSGEDRISEAGGEGLYGRYELTLRRMESSVCSIVGASGSFYAQRRSLCPSFAEGLAPDFLSVLHTVQQGFRAVSEPTAIGYMKSVKDPRHEFDRKVRTLIRGLTTLFRYAHLLNPVAYGRFALMLISHKLLRWLAPTFMAVALWSAFVLRGSPLYFVALIAQLTFYGLGAGATFQWFGLGDTSVGRVAGYMVTSNAAALLAWWRYFRGIRQELWTPSIR